MADRAALKISVDVFDGDSVKTFHSLVAVESDVRSEHHFRAIQEPVMGNQFGEFRYPLRRGFSDHCARRAPDPFRNLLAENLGCSPSKDAFILKDIKADAGDLSCIQGLDKRTRIDKPTASGIYQQDAGSAEREGVAVDHVTRGRSKRGVQCYHIRLTQQLFKARIAKIQQLAIKGMRRLIVCEHAHAEAGSDADDMKPNAARANHPKSFTPQVEATQPLPTEAACADGSLGISEPAGEREHESKSMFGDGVFPIGPDISNANSAFVTNIEIDVVAAGRTGGDQANERVIIQKGAVDFLCDKHRDDFRIFGHLIESFHEQYLVFGKRLFKQRFGLIL